MSEETEDGAAKNNLYRKARAVIWTIKQRARFLVSWGLSVALSKIFCCSCCSNEYDCKTEENIKHVKHVLYCMLLWFRVFCKTLFGLACLGVCGYAIALLFYKPLQTFLGFDLRGFVKLLFAHNIGAIFKLIAVVGSGLYVGIYYLAKSIGSSCALIRFSYKKRDEKFIRRWESIGDLYNDIKAFGDEDVVKISGFELWAIEYTNLKQNQPPEKFTAMLKNFGL
jgi:hypothetical protein